MPARSSAATGATRRSTDRAARGRRLAGRFAPLLLSIPSIAALAGCDGAPPPPAGLTRTLQRVLPNDTEGTPHGAQLLEAPETGRLFVADSFGGVLAYDGDGLLPTFHAYRPGAEVGCTALARHAASHTLYCGALDAGDVAIFDDETGEIHRTNDGSMQALGYRSLLVAGGWLYGAKAPSGVDRRAIAPDGSLGDPEPLLEGAFQQLAAGGATVYAAGTGAGLVSIGEDGSVTEIAPLDGPVIRLRVRDGRAAVALGSQGVAVVDLAPGGAVTTLHPPCAAISADVAGDVLAMGCYSGVYAYDLAAGRVFGWARAQFGIMDVVLSGSRLTALDWWRLDTHSMDPAGFARAVDAPPGYLVEPGRALTITVRNPGDLPLHLDGQELPAYGEMTVDVDAAPETRTLDLRADEGASGDTTSVVIARDERLPGIGAPFVIPGMEGTLVYFSTGTCALQWPAMDDLAWLTLRGEPPGGLPPLVIAPDGADSPDTVAPWVQTAMPALWSPLEVVALGALLPGRSGSETFYQDIDPGRLLPGGDEEAQFWVDAAGTVRWFERAYGGAAEAAAPP